MNNQAELLHLLTQTTLFPPEAAGLLLEAIETELMTAAEQQQLLETLRQERDELGSIAASEQAALVKRKEQYGLTK